MQHKFCSVAFIQVCPNNQSWPNMNPINIQLHALYVIPVFFLNQAPVWARFTINNSSFPDSLTIHLCNCTQLLSFVSKHKADTSWFSLSIIISFPDITSLMNWNFCILNRSMREVQVPVRF